MSKPIVLVDPQPRTLHLIFDPETRARLEALATLVVHEDGRMPDDLIERHLPKTLAIIGQTDLPRDRLQRASELRAIFNVETNFLQNVDYDHCFANGIHVLTPASAFATAVAESALGMAIDLARGITAADAAFRSGDERYGLEGNADTFLLSGAQVGIIGFGDLGQELHRLLAPFQCPVAVYDPWLPERAIRDASATPMALDQLLARSRVIFVFASVTSDNEGFLGPREFGLIQQGSLFLLLSRAGAVDFNAFLDCVASGRIRAATDVFPIEPVPKDDPLRRLPNLLLSAHRTGGMPEAFYDIGRQVVADLELIMRGLPPRVCRRAERETVHRMRSKAVDIS